MTKTQKIVSGIVAAPLVAIIAVIVLFTTGIISFGETAENRVTALKVGKYYLELEDGCAQNEYIEIFDDGTIQFVGDYWEETEDPEEKINCDVWTTRQYYVIKDDDPNQTFVAVTNIENFDFYEMGFATGVTMYDENTFEVQRTYDSVTNADSDEGEVKYYSLPYLNGGTYDVAHYVYVE